MRAPLEICWRSAIGLLRTRECVFRETVARVIRALPAPYNLCTTTYI